MSWNSCPDLRFYNRDSNSLAKNYPAKDRLQDRGPLYPYFHLKTEESLKNNKPTFLSWKLKKYQIHNISRYTSNEQIAEK